MPINLSLIGQLTLIYFKISYLAKSIPNLQQLLLSYSHMKSITYDKSRPKLPKEILNKKQNETRSTLNSGRSSTNNNHKRNSHQFIHQTQILKNLNKSTALCLNLNLNHTPSSISHKVIHQNSQINPKKTFNKNIKFIDNQTLTKKIHKQRFIHNPSSKDKKKKFSIQSSDTNKFHSHRQSLALNFHQIPSSQRTNSEQKQNVCPNINTNYKKPNQHQNRPHLSKLSFILEKDMKEKGNLTKKKLLISNQYPVIKEGFNLKQKETLTKDKSILTRDDKQNQIRSTSNSIKDSKKSISSGRNHTIEKKKQTIRYISKRDHLQDKRKVKIKLEDPENRQSQRQYLKLKSPSDLSQYGSGKQDKTLSIKSLLRALIDSGSNVENDQSKNIRKIIDCLTTNDNEPIEDQRLANISEERQAIQDIHTQSEKVGKQSEGKIRIQINGFNLSQVQKVNQINNTEVLSDDILNQPNMCHKYYLSLSDYQQLIDRMQLYEIRIANLYEELIEEKGKRYQLQEMIERYIIQKEGDSDRY